MRAVATPALLVAIALLAGCGKPVATTDDIRPVRVMTVAPASTSAVAELAGDVRPRFESRVGFQVPGRLTSRQVEVGQAVKAGQTLATINAADYRLSAEAGRANLAAAKVERDLQRADYQRFEELHRQGFIGGAELERRKTALDAAEARYRQAAAQATVSGNQAAYAVLAAPTDGVVTAVDAEVGQVVEAGQSVVRIAQTGEKEVAIAIPENRLEALRQIPVVRVVLWANGDELRASVREIAPIADPATRTYPARVTLIDPPADVSLGMTATVRFEAPLPTPIIVVPLQALLREGDQTYVWRLDRSSMTVARSAVEVVNVSGNDLVVSRGVSPGDTIVTAGVHLLKEGQKVKLLEADPAGRSSPKVPASPTPLPQPGHESGEPKPKG